MEHVFSRRRNMSSDLLYFLLIISICQADNQQSYEVKISIISKRNETGHWNAQLQLEHGGTDGRPVELDVDHTTIKDDNDETVRIVASVSGPPRRPQPDFKLIQGLGYYKLLPGPYTWNEGRSKCENYGAHLAIINSEKEALALRQLWLPYAKIYDDWRNDWALIGIHDNYSEGNYVTIFDVPLANTGYSKWYPNEPNGGAAQNFGVLHRKLGTLGDVGINEKLAVLCELEL